MIQDWNDTNSDGVVDVDEVWQVNYGFSTGTTNEATVGFPTSKFKYTPILFVYQRNAAEDPVTSVPFKIYIRFYDRVSWNWINLSSTTFAIPAGSSESFNATLNVPLDACQGTYEGQITVNVTEPYYRTIVIPVSVCVPATVPSEELIYSIDQPQAVGPYDPYVFEGYFDWSWRYEAGDWRSWLFEFTDPSTVAAFVSADWAGNMTDIDMFSIHPSGIFVDGTGGYWIEDGKFSWNTRTDSTEEYVMLYTGSITESQPIPNVHTVLMHNVLFDGTVFPENVSCKVKVVNIEPTLPAEMTVLAGESQSLTFNLTTGMKLTNVSLSTIAPFPVEIEPNSVAEIPAMGSWSFEVTVSVPSEMPSGTYSVDVLLTTDEVPPGSHIPLSISVDVLAVKMTDVTLDVGKVHFPGELAQLHILLAHEGTLINVTDFDQVMLWYKTADGIYHSVNLNGSVEPIDLGLYEVPFEVPAEAVSCALVVRVETYVEEMNAVCRGVSMVSFDVSSLLSNWNAWLEAVVENVAVIRTDVGIVKVNLSSLNAELVSLNETEAEISTMLGSIRANVSDIGLKVTSIEGGTARIETTLASLNGTVVNIEGNVATIETEIGTVKAKVEAVPLSVSGIWLAVAFSLISLVASVWVVILLSLKKQSRKQSEKE